jgi:hypothetical protein
MRNVIEPPYVRQDVLSHGGFPGLLEIVRRTRQATGAFRRAASEPHDFSCWHEIVFSSCLRLSESP